MAALAVAMGVGRFAFTPLLPLMQADAGVTLTEGSWLAFANYLGYLVGALATVWMRNAPHRMVKAGLAATGLLTAAMGLAQGFAVWWVLRFLGGVAAGITVTGIVCLALSAAGFGSAAIWIAFGIASLVACAWCWNAFGPAPEIAAPAIRPERADSRPGWGRAAWTLIVAYGLYGFGYIIPGTFLPVIARDLLGGGFASGWFWPMFGAAAFGGTLLLGFAFVAITTLTLREARRWYWPQAGSHCG